MLMFRIAIAGDLPSEGGMHQEMREIYDQICSNLHLENHDKKDRQIWFLVSPIYTESSWEMWTARTGFPIKCFTSPEMEKWEARQTLCLHTKQRHFIGERICADADLLLAVWDESSEAMNGAVLEILRMARRKALPCIWVSSRTKKIFWPEETLYLPFSVDKLQNLCKEKMVPLLDPSLEKMKGKDRKIPFLGIGMRLQAAYLKKYKAAPPAVPPAEDQMLKESYEMPGFFREQEPLRKKMLEKFKLFDQAAIRLNKKYLGVIYWQAILPFIITGFLALGFYSEDVLGALFIPKNVLIAFSGAGFLMNACLTLYKYRLDRSRTARRWQTTFVQYRGVAELLRVLIHFIPFGINLDLRKLCSEDPAVFRTVRETAWDDRQGTVHAGRESAQEILLLLKEMVEDQLSYHELSVKRFSGIVKKLDKWAKVVFYTGLAFVVARGFLKLFIIIHPLSHEYIGNVPFNVFAGTSANMLAMILPAWAAYFSTKLSQCNYKYDLENHRHMVTSLRQISDQISMIEENFLEVPLEYVSALGESVAQTMLGEDTVKWMSWHRRNAG